MSDTPGYDEQMRMIEYRLGMLTDDEKDRFESALRDDPDLQGRYEAFVAPLAHLDAVDPVAPEGLADRILAAAETARPRDDRSDRLAAVTDAPRRWVFPTVLKDVAAAAAAIIVVTCIWLTTASHARSESQKILCAGNLGNMGHAIAAYANDYPDQLPQAAGPWNTCWYDQGNRRPRRPHLFILIKRGYAEPGQLICPASRVKIRVIKGLDSLDDFPKSMRITYSFQNLYGESRFTPNQRRRRWEQAASMAIMADQTPLIENDMLKTTLDPLSPSRNHRGGGLEGQNVLTIDGSVRWMDKPLLGINEDNIWQIESLLEYTGTEVPDDPTDSFLAP